jgi:hypothetical protein
MEARPDSRFFGGWRHHRHDPDNRFFTPHDSVMTLLLPARTRGDRFVTDALKDAKKKRSE